MDICFIFHIASKFLWIKILSVNCKVAWPEDQYLMIGHYCKLCNNSTGAAAG